MAMKTTMMMNCDGLRSILVMMMNWTMMMMMMNCVWFSDDDELDDVF